MCRSLAPVSRLAQAALVIVVVPIVCRVGHFNAWLGARLLCSSRQPFCDACRVLAAEGVPGDTVVAMRHADRATVAIESKLSVAAGLTVKERDRERPIFEHWQTVPLSSPVASPMGRTGRAARADEGGIMSRPAFQESITALASPPTPENPAAGTRQILKAARACKLKATGADIAPVAGIRIRTIDFFADATARPNLVTNPPYGLMREFAEHALELAELKVAMLVPLARLNAARWIERTPLRRVWLLTPRPSIPPHSYLLTGRKPQGGRVDFCWLVWDRHFRGAPQVRWLSREESKKL